MHQGHLKSRPAGVLLALTCLSGLPGLALAQATDKAAAAEPMLALSEDGSLIIDRVSRLAWTRCAEGMTWDGRTCTGQIKRMTYGEALALASARYKDEGVGWRIPRLTELRRLAGLEQTPKLLVADPRDWTWSSTLRIESVESNAYNYDNITRGAVGRQDHLGVQQGWAIHLGSGQTRGDVSRKTLLEVRLVRPAP